MPDVLDALPRSYPRSFVPADLDVQTFEDAEPLLQQLAEADLSTVPALEKWLRDRSEVEAIINELGSRIHIRTTLDTGNAEYKRAFMDWVEKFEPKLKPVSDALDRKFRDAPARAKLDPAKYGVYERGVLTQLDLYRDENIPLETEVSKLRNQYDEVQGATVIDFEGKRYTPSQIGKLQYEADRGLRERAWRATFDRRMKDEPVLTQLFDQQVRLREKIGRNGGCADYREYTWKSYQRFDYTPKDCDAYADAVEQVILPAVKRIYDRRRAAMKLDKLRPWDATVDPHNLPPLKPFDDVEELKAGCSRIFQGIDGELGSQFERMRELGLLDLANRQGKAPGGYQSTLSEARLPFIFMNAVGLNQDVNTLLHEGGHAFHAFAAADQELLPYRHAPMEFCEVASMSMELLGGARLSEFYDEADARRARRDHLERALELMARIAQGDQFQHWIYTHVGNDAEARTAKWIECAERFGVGTDWSGLEKQRRMSWQAIGHFFWAPFYFIEYAIAQIGAFQVWLNARRDPAGALAKYRHALSLGGSRGLRDLFKAAGLKFGMDAETLKPLVDAVEHELEAL